MASSPALRRLIEMPGVVALERAAVLKPLPEIGEGRTSDPEIDACVLELFGLTPDEAEAFPRPGDWDDIEHKAIPKQVAALEAAGWDLTDNKRRPLRVFEHFNQALWLALRGVAGSLPFIAADHVDETPDTVDWGSEMAAEAARFQKR